ncbi:MAG: response regulator [Bacteroidia bacterium]
MSKKKLINIFIVDDNIVFSLALRADIEVAFKSIPIKIHLFEIGKKCKKMFEIIMPELVILDYNLNSDYPSASNGIKVLDWIKKVNPETNVIMLTGEDNIDIAVKSFQQGAFDYVVKTATQFSKINYSLKNIFKVMEAKIEAKKYKRQRIALFICIAILIGGIITIQILRFSLSK